MPHHVFVDLPHTFYGYTLQEKLYESSKTIIFRAEGKDKKDIVILKLAPASEEQFAGFTAQGNIQRKLGHIPGVLKIYDIKFSPTYVGLFLEDILGRSLFELTSSEKSLPLADLLHVAVTVCDTLSKVHATPTLHLDISPGNIIFNPATKEVRLIDFDLSFSGRRQKPMELTGTMSFIPPEQTARTNNFLDNRSDIYSMGATLYFAVTKQLPFTATDDLDFVHKLIAVEPVPIVELVGNSAEFRKSRPAFTLFCKIIAKMMSKNPENRYQSALGVKSDLNYCQKLLTSNSDDSSVPFVIGANDYSTELLLSQKLYGREMDIEQLKNALKNISGEDREVVCLAGVSGMGKSALIKELERNVAVSSGYLISGKFEQFHEDSQCYGITSAIVSWCTKVMRQDNAYLMRLKERFHEALNVQQLSILAENITSLVPIIGEQPDLNESDHQIRFSLFQSALITFFTIIAAPTQPVALFLDDVQWIDAGTVSFLETMLVRSMVPHVMIVLAYRSNEVDDAHIITDLLRKISEKQEIQRIEVKPLTAADIACFLKDSFHGRCDASQIDSLAECSLRKTGGNPFYVQRFVMLLYEDNLITFDEQTFKWRWAIEDIERKNTTDNVADVAVSKLKNLFVLHPNLESVLQLASATGFHFDAKLVSEALQLSFSETLKSLHVALQSDLISASSVWAGKDVDGIDDKILLELESKIKFLFSWTHDKLQAALFNSISAEKLQQVKLALGRTLLRQFFLKMSKLGHDLAFASTLQHPKLISDVNVMEATQILLALRDGQSLMTDKNEFRNLCIMYYLSISIGLRCGGVDRCKEWAAESLELIKKVHNGDMQEAWKVDYELTYALHMSAADTACGANDCVTAKSIINSAAPKCQTELHAAKLERILIYALDRNHIDEKDAHIYSIIAKRFRNLGIDMPSSINLFTAIKIILETKKKLATVMTMINDVPIVDDELLKCTVEMSNDYLKAISASDALNYRLMVAILICKQAELALNPKGRLAPETFSLQFGLTASMLVCQDFATAKIISDHLQAKHNPVSTVYEEIFAHCILHMVYLGWMCGEQSSSAVYCRQVQTDLMTGRLTSATSIMSCNAVLGFGDMDIPTVKRLKFPVILAITRVGENSLVVKSKSVLLLCYAQFIENISMEDNEAPWELQSGDYWPSDTEEVPRSEHPTWIINHVMRGFMLTLFELPGGWDVMAGEVYRNMEGFLQISIYANMGSFIALVALRELQERHRRAKKSFMEWMTGFRFRMQLERVATLTIQKLEFVLAKLGSSYFTPMTFLLKAELCRSRGRCRLAHKHYNQAITTAAIADQKFVEAMAQEAKGTLFIEEEEPWVAAKHFAEAINLYSHYGALAKVSWMSAKYADLFAKMKTQQTVQSQVNKDAKADNLLPTSTKGSAHPMSTGSTSVSRGGGDTDKAKKLDSVDMKTLLTATRAVSRQIDMTKLLQTMLELSLRNSGASRCLFITPQATDDLNAEPVCLLRAECVSKTTSSPVAPEVVPEASAEPLIPTQPQLQRISAENGVYSSSDGMSISSNSEISSTPVKRNRQAPQPLSKQLMRPKKLSTASDETENDLIVKHYDQRVLKDSDAPIDIIQFCLRSLETVVLGDACRDQNKTNSYFENTKMHSVLCHPISSTVASGPNRKRVLGVIYLENSKLPDVFTQDRSIVIGTICAQASIAMENSKLVSSIARFVPTEMIPIIGPKPVTEVELGDCCEKILTVMFMDVRNFTSISEKLGPFDVFGFINRLFGFMTEEIERNNGVVDAYIGDAIMAVFSSASDAVNAAVGMIQVLEKLNKQVESGDWKWLGDSTAFNQREFKVKIGIGIHTGNVVLGMVGGKKRIACTLLGDTVNLASRLESQCKAYLDRNIFIVISEHTHERLSFEPPTAFTSAVTRPRYPVSPTTRRFRTEELGEVSVKGKLEKIVIYGVTPTF